MTIAWMPATSSWDGPNDSIRWSDLALADFMTTTAEHGLRSPDERAFAAFIAASPHRARIERRAAAQIPEPERDRARAVDRGLKQAALAAFTERQIRVGERLLGIRKEDR